MASTRATVTKKKKPTQKTTAKTTNKKPVTNKSIQKRSTKTPAKSGAATKKKPAVKPVQATALVPVKTENPRNTLEKSGVIADVGIDFCGLKITDRRRSFLLYYLTPGQNGFHNARRAALKAGYSESTASVDVYRLLRDPEIQKIVNANDKFVHTSLREAAKLAIEAKKSRAFFDIIDFYNETEIDTEYGPLVRRELKPLKELTEEQRMCIDGIKYEGQASIPVYLLPDRAKEQNDIIKMDAELAKSIADMGEEETREIIIERITIRETERAQLPAELEYEIIEDPIEVQAEDDDDV